MDPRRYRSANTSTESPAPKTYIDGFVPPSRSLPKTPIAVAQPKPVFTPPAVKSQPLPDQVRRALPRQRLIRLQPKAPALPAAPRALPPRTEVKAASPYAPRQVAHSIQPQYQRQLLPRLHGLSPLTTRLRRPRELPRWLVAIPAGMLVVWLGVSLFRHPTVPLEANQTLSQRSSVQTQTKVPVIPTYPTAQQQATFEAAVQNIFAQNSDVRATVVARNLKTDKQIVLGDSQPYIAASTGKLLTAATVFKEVEAGRAHLSHVMSNGMTMQATLQQMIVESDNDCWAVLNAYVGQSKLTADAKAIGMTRYNYSDNSLLTTDTATLVQKLYDGTLLNPADSDLLMGWMKIANYQGYMSAVVPSDYTFYHKVGIYADVLHEAAIITHGDEALELVIYTEGQGPADDARTQMIQQITQAALAAFFKPTS